MSIRIFKEKNENGKWTVYQENSGKGRFEVKSFSTSDEAQKLIDEMQRAIDNKTLETTVELPLFVKDTPEASQGTEQDIKSTTEE